MVKLYAKIINSFYSLTILAKCAIIDVCQGRVLNMHLVNSLMTEVLPYRNQSIDLQSKSMDWFLYDKDLCPERVKWHSG